MADDGFSQSRDESWSRGYEWEMLLSFSYGMLHASFRPIILDFVDLVVVVDTIISPVSDLRMVDRQWFA